MATVDPPIEIVRSIWEASSRQSPLSLSSLLQELPWASSAWSNNLAILDSSPHFQKTLIPALEAWDELVRESKLMRSWRVWLKIDPEEQSSDATTPHVFIHQRCSMIALYRIFDAFCVERFGWSHKILPRVPYTAIEPPPRSVPSYLNDWGKVLEDFVKIAGKIVVNSNTVIKESEDPILDLARIINNIETTEKKFPIAAKRLLRNIHSVTAHLAHLIGHDYISNNDGLVILPDWYRYESVGNEDRKNTVDCNFRYNLQVVALLSPIFAVVSETLLQSKLIWRRDVLMEYSRRLGNDKPKLVQKVEMMFWKMLLRIASHEIGVGEGIKELASVLPLQAIRAQSQSERQWFMLVSTDLQASVKRKKVEVEQVSREVVATSPSNPGFSYEKFIHSGCFQHIRLQAPSSMGLHLPNPESEFDELFRVQCNIPAHTLAGFKTQYFFLAQEIFASYLDQWLEAVMNHLNCEAPRYLNPSERTESGFVVEPYDVVSDTTTMQRALSKQNVILMGAPDIGRTFDGPNLSQFYPVKSKITILDHVHDPPEKHLGTLHDLIEASRVEDGPVFSTERLALPEGSVWPIGISSDIAAWRATKGQFFCPADEVISTSHIRGTFVALKGAFNGTQIACDGFGMVVKVECGALWFIVGIPIEKETGFRLGDYRGEGFEFNVNEPDCTKWVYEAVLLTPGTQLVLRPNTPFATVALEHTFYTVDHFYSTSNLVETLAGLFHLLCSPHMTRSASISSSCALLQRYTICLHAALVLNVIDEYDPVSGHLPNIRTSGGVSNFLAACVIAINLDIFDWSSYGLRNGSLQGLDRYCYVRELAYELLEWFFFHYTLKETSSSQQQSRSSEGEDTTTTWTLEDVLRSNGRFIASIVQSIPSELEHGEASRNLSSEILHAIIHQVFPMDHENGGAVIRQEYQDTIQDDLKNRRVDFSYRSWAVSATFISFSDVFQPKARRGEIDYNRS